MFKEMLRKIKKYFSYESCYKQMEKQGIAVFCMCKGVVGGDRFTDYLDYNCVDCPYLTLLDGSNNNG